MITGVNVTQRGSSHINKGTDVQDYSTLKLINSKDGLEWVICAIADGVGSCSNSQYGSETACETFVKKVVDKLTESEDISDDEILWLLKEGYEAALIAVEDKADEMMRPFMTFDTTLTTAVFSKKGLFYGHCGDGGIVALFEDTTYEMITHRHKGELANSVVPLRADDYWEFGKAERKVASFAMMTDGVLDAAVGNKFTNNRIYFPFFGPTITAEVNGQADLDEVKQYIEDDLASEEYRNIVKDDLTYAVIWDTEIVNSLPEIEFDIEKWDSDTKAYAQLSEKYLRESAEEQAKMRVKPIPSPVPKLEPKPEPELEPKPKPELEPEKDNLVAPIKKNKAYRKKKKIIATKSRQANKKTGKKETKNKKNNRHKR